jgi:hypothetical protein
LRSVLTPDLDDVLEAFVRHKDHTSAASLEERICCHCRAMKEREAISFSKNFLDAVEHSLGRIVRCRRHLKSPYLIAREQNEIGERSARINRKKRHCRRVLA